MIIKNRWKEIVRILKINDIATVVDLVNTLGVSEATIRRDLAQMEDEHLLTRFHGGAQFLQSNRFEESMEIKSLNYIEDKRHLAIFASRLIKDNSVIYLDAGSTTLSLIQFINAKNITVVTNGIPHAMKLAQKGIKTYLVGGLVKGNTEAVTGKETLDTVRNMNFDMALMGTNGVHPIAGYTTPEEYEGEVKRTVIHNSKTTYILAHSAKMNVLCFVPFATLQEAILITDDQPPFPFPEDKLIVLS